MTMPARGFAVISRAFSVLMELEPAFWPSFRRPFFARTSITRFQVRHCEESSDEAIRPTLVIPDGAKRRSGISRFRVRPSGAPERRGLMTWTCLRHLATSSVRVVIKSFARKSEGAGNAGCPLHPQPRVECKNTRVSHHESTGTPGIPARDGFNGFLRALPGDRALLPPSSARCGSTLANLMPASGHQDHTALPSANRLRSSVASPASIASHRNVRDDRDPPLSAVRRAR
jgi:hypothetical protein